ncbi:hypothetical protein CGBL_0128550 [Corynebacterium glutamicum]|nr:hypothetical protein CGBL_0128550 [Corynebacterium glutamicum]
MRNFRKRLLVIDNSMYGGAHTKDCVETQITLAQSLVVPGIPLWALVAPDTPGQFRKLSGYVDHP